MVSGICPPLLLILGNASRQLFLQSGYSSEAPSSSMSELDKDLVLISSLASLHVSLSVCLWLEHLIDFTDGGFPVISLTTASLLPYPYYIVSLSFQRIPRSHS